MQWNWTEI